MNKTREDAKARWGALKSLMEERKVQRRRSDQPQSPRRTRNHQPHASEISDQRPAAPWRLHPPSRRKLRSRWKASHPRGIRSAPKISDETTTFKAIPRHRFVDFKSPLSIMTPRVVP
jgi:hypothetical protein